MVTPERVDHQTVVRLEEDPFEDNVEPLVQGVANSQVDESDVRPAGHVVFAEDHPAQIVLPDQSDTPTVTLTTSAATEDLPLAEFPRSTISRVVVEPVSMPQALLRQGK